MSKELKALKELREDAKHHLDSHTKYLNERLDIIETALKILEQLQIIIGAEKIEDLPKLALETENACYNACYKLKETEKKLKALEIIKEIFKIEISIDDYIDTVKPCGVVFLYGKDIVWNIYKTFDKENIQKLKLLKEVLNNGR